MPVDFTPAPEPMPSPVTGDVRLPHAARPPFVLTYHPARWLFRDGKLLPALKTVVIEPGVGGVDKSGDSTIADAARMRAGETILPWTATPDGQPYLVRYPARGGWYHCERWERPRQLAGRVMPSETDREGRDAWLLWLVESGAIPAITQEARELIREGLVGEVNYHTGKAATGSAVAIAALDAATARLAAFDALSAPPKPAPAPKAKAAA